MPGFHQEKLKSFGVKQVMLVVFAGYFFVLGEINVANLLRVPLSSTGGTVKNEALNENFCDINPCFDKIVLDNEIIIAYITQVNTFSQRST